MKNIAVNIVRGILVVLSKLPLKFHYFMGDVFAWMASMPLTIFTAIFFIVSYLQTTNI